MTDLGNPYVVFLRGVKAALTVNPTVDWRAGEERPEPVDITLTWKEFEHLAVLALNQVGRTIEPTVAPIEISPEEADAVTRFMQTLKPWMNMTNKRLADAEWRLEQLVDHVMHKDLVDDIATGKTPADPPAPPLYVSGLCICSTPLMDPRVTCRTCGGVGHRVERVDE